MIVTQDSRTTALLARRRRRCPCSASAGPRPWRTSCERRSLALALYVSHHPRNFQFLRWPELAHVLPRPRRQRQGRLGVQPAQGLRPGVRRGPGGGRPDHRDALWFDPERLVGSAGPRCPRSAPRRHAGGPATVLYAPTWEGAQTSMSYSSVPSHGVPLVRSLFDGGLPGRLPAAPADRRQPPGARRGRRRAPRPARDARVSGEPERRRDRRPARGGVRRGRRADHRRVVARGRVAPHRPAARRHRDRPSRARSSAPHGCSMPSPGLSSASRRGGRSWSAAAWRTTSEAADRRTPWSSTTSAVRPASVALSRFLEACDDRPAGRDGRGPPAAGR